MYEIERKFTVREMPADLDKYDHIDMEQGYLCTEPVVRVRRENDKYVLTYKGSGLMVREEANLALTKEGFEHLIKKADGHIIRKTRYIIPIDNGLKIELDIFKEPKELVMAEVEFPDEESANAFKMPDWFDKDVTQDPAYHNSNMAVKG